MAVEKVSPTKAKIVIFSDTTSVLMALVSHKDHSEVIMKLSKISLANPQIKLNWVRAHVGIYGNELADLSANNSTTKEEVDIKEKIPNSWINTLSKTPAPTGLDCIIQLVTPISTRGSRPSGLSTTNCEEKRGEGGRVHFTNPYVNRTSEYKGSKILRAANRQRVKNQLKVTMLREWQARWGSSSNSRFLYGIFPGINTKRGHGDFLINHILTTHGCFSVHTHRIFGKSLDCECGRDQGSFSHYVYLCQIEGS
ncbi:hypothetical protein AVEN_251970-1 [Araneus ventricosus]|uniref:RNase H type-1 domain-containing protein n=1 Tax=Araneus ventricosus TaxID=182803 RepID=A0A4Y2HN35_ARAVE|nr:hypothetical protein AVEN_251970-1 [Araneus ventricosus]